MTRTRFEVVSPPAAMHVAAMSAPAPALGGRRRHRGGRWSCWRAGRGASWAATGSCGGSCRAGRARSLGQASASLEQLLVAPARSARLRGDGAGRRQPHPRHRAGAEVRRGDGAGRARGPSQVVGRHAAGGAGRERQGAGGDRRRRRCEEVNLGASPAVKAGVRRARPPTSGRCPTRCRSIGLAPIRSGDQTPALLVKGLPLGQEPAGDRRDDAGRGRRGVHRRARRRQQRGGPRSWTRRFGRRAGSPKGPSRCPTGGRSYWCASARAGDGRHRGARRLAGAAPPPARAGASAVASGRGARSRWARCCCLLLIATHDEQTEETREEIDSQRKSPDRSESPPCCWSPAPRAVWAAESADVEELRARNAPAAGAASGAAHGDRRGRGVGSPAGRDADPRAQEPASASRSRRRRAATAEPRAGAVAEPPRRHAPPPRAEAAAVAPARRQSPPRREPRAGNIRGKVAVPGRRAGRLRLRREHAGAARSRDSARSSSRPGRSSCPDGRSSSAERRSSSRTRTTSTTTCFRSAPATRSTSGCTTRAARPRRTPSPSRARSTSTATSTRRWRPASWSSRTGTSPRSKADGTFEIAGRPAGRRKVVAWAPGSRLTADWVEVGARAAPPSSTCKLESKTPGHKNKSGQAYGSYE